MATIGDCTPAPTPSDDLPLLALEAEQPKISRHTFDCLVQRLIELGPELYKKFSVCAADRGLDVACSAGLRYIKRVESGAACCLKDGKAYLRTIAMRAAARYERDEARKRSNIPVELLIDREKSQPTENNEVLDAVKALTERQERAITLVHFLGYSFREAASVMGITHQTVNEHLRRAYARLRESLGE